jgi:uncharacterized protein (TIGR03643 family)
MAPEQAGAVLFQTFTFFAAVFHLPPVLLPLFTPGKRAVTNRAYFGWQMRLFMHAYKTTNVSVCLPYMDFTEREIDRIIEMAWEDRTPFDAIEAQFGLPEKEVIKLMRREMKESSFKMWRARVQGRNTKHSAKRGFTKGRHKSAMQRQITANKISKR